MKNKITKFTSLLIATLIFISTLPLSSFADDLKNNYVQQEKLAVEYLELSAENEWLNANNDIEKFVDTESEGGAFSLLRTNVLSKFRDINKTEKENFLTEYEVEYSGPKNFDVLVRVIETISFSSNEKDNHYSNTYIITFNEENKITDVNKINDWFELTYRYSGKTEPIITSELTKEFVNNIEPNVAAVKENNLFENFETTSNIEYLMYSPENAVNYALTYSGDNSKYYNDNFIPYADVGGDCMNFSSQSMWAGLGGSNSKEVIESNILFNNYLEDSTDRWAFNQSPWVGVMSFYNYITSDKAKDDGLIAKTWRIEPGQWDLGIEEDLLLGAIALVPGEKPENEFGHAVVITEVNGTTRNDLKYSGHTTDRHQAPFGKHYADCPIIIVRPIYYKNNHNCLFDGHLYPSLEGMITGEKSECIWCGHSKLSITNNLIEPLLIGDTRVLASKASMNVFKMSVKIESPSGEVIWLRDEYNTNFIKRQYTFTEPGLYKITTYAQDINDILNLETNEISNSYYVRVTYDLNQVNTNESEYVDSNYFDTDNSFDFTPNYNIE